MVIKLRTLLLFALLLLVMGVGVFLFFKGFFEFAKSNFAVEIMAAVLGTVMITIITTLLLSSQTSAEERKEKSLGVFQHKLDIYTKFLDFLYDIIQDGKLDAPEVKELTKWTTRVSLIAGERAMKKVSLFTQQCILLRKFRYQDLTEEEIARWREWFKEETKEEPGEDNLAFISVGDVVAHLRQDLGEMNLSKEEQVIMGGVVVDSLVNRLCEGRASKAEEVGMATIGSS